MKRSRRKEEYINTAIELDEYETVSSGDDDEGYMGEDNDDDDNPINHINIRYDEYSETYLPDVQIRDTEDPFKNTELVLKFSPQINIEALKWFIKRVTTKKSQGGAELLLRREPYFGRDGEGLVVHVTARGWRLLEVAEKLEIKKMDYLREVPRPFKLQELGSFLTESMEISDILTPAEKQIVVMHELRHFHVHPGETHVPGYKQIKLTTGQSIFHVFTSRQLLTSYFALHQEHELNKLQGKWFWEFWDPSPYEDIRSYFGDNTCLYFNFVAYYSYALIVPAIIGLIMRMLPDHLFHHLVFLFCIINMMFVTIFFINWHSYQSLITYKWGTLGMNRWEEPRETQDGGVLTLDPITGQIQRRYPYFTMVFKTYVLSPIVVLSCCAAAIWCMYEYLEWEIKAKSYAKGKVKGAESTSEELFWEYGFIYIPATIYATVVFLLTKMYRWLANHLTEWEKHRTETQFEKNLVYKMVVFEVANGFSLLLYTAFWIKDVLLLQRRLFVLLAIFQLFMTLEQCFVPLLFRKGQAKMHGFLEQNKLLVTNVFRGSASTGSIIGDGALQQPIPYPGLDGLGLDVLDKQDKRVQMSIVEEAMAPYRYEEDFDEYLNLYLQFGYIFLFSSVYPPAAALALVSNLLLLSLSLFKRREVYQRALARRVSSIGAWQQAFALTGIFAVITNCALLAIHKPLRDEFPTFSDTEWFLLFVVIEHFILGLQYTVKKLCPKVPYEVKISLARLEYRSKMALQREQATATRRRMGQVYQPINKKLADRIHTQELGSDTKGNAPGGNSTNMRHSAAASPGTIKGAGPKQGNTGNTGRNNKTVKWKKNN